MSSETVADVRFIAHELIRFAELTPEETFRHLNEHREDSFATIPSTQGGHLFIGRAAYDRFDDIAKRELRAWHPKDTGDFNIPKVADALRQAFTSVFLAGQREIDDDSVTAMVESGLAEARKTHIVITHHIPCIITLEREPERFAVGPVEFQSTSSFLKNKAQAFEDYRARVVQTKNADADGTEPIEDVVVNRTKEFYEKFPWVANVTVPACDQKVSETRAINVVDAALDALRLFFPDPFGARLRRAYADAIVPRTAAITSDESGEISITTYYNSDDAPSWLGQLLTEYGDFLTKVGEWLFVHVGTGEVAELHRRYLDALHWYGQAIGDQMHAGRLVKLAAVLERLTVAKERHSSVTRVVTNRTALLAQGHRDMDFKAVKKTSAEVYSWRSHLMHGSQSPFEPKVREVTAVATALVRWVMFTALTFYRQVEYQRSASDAELELAFEEWLRSRKRNAG